MSSMIGSDIKRCPFCGSVKPILWDEDKKEWVYFTVPLTDEEKESRDRILKILEDAEIDLLINGYDGDDRNGGK